VTTAAVEFAAPAALWALGLAAPVVALHLYHRRRRRVDVAFLPLIREGAGATNPFGGLRRLADLASLLARLGALAALVLALAGPRPAHAGVLPGDVVLVVDADPTTRAKEPDGTTRFEHAVRLAKALVHARREGAVSVVLAGETPATLVAPTRDRDAAARSLDGVEPGAATSDLGAAVDLARATAPTARVVVLSAKAYEPLAGVEVLGTGTASDDQGFVDQFVGPADDGVRTTVRWTVKNFAKEERTRRVTLRLGERDLGTRDLRVPPRSTASDAIDVAPPRDGAPFVARLEGTDVLASNDATAAWLTPVPRPSVLVVHGGAPRPFVTAFLDAMGDSIDREASGAVPAADFAKAALRDVVLVDGAALPTAPGPGSYVLLAPFSGAGLPFAPGRAVKEPLVWRTDPSHPLLRGVDLSTAFVVRGTTIAGEGVRGLAFVEGDPIVAEGERNGVRWIAFGLDPDGSDLAIRSALPVWLKNAVHRVGVLRSAPVEPFYRAGSTIEPRGLDPGTASLAREEAPIVSGAPLGPWRVVVDVYASDGGGRVLGGKSYRIGTTVRVDLDPDRDVRAARAEAVPPPPAPPVEDVEGRWRLWLLAAAACLLVLDLIAARGGASKLARAAISA
jgi:hypothetical protein